MRLAMILAVICALTGAAATRADSIVLKNGDHLTGTISGSDGKTVTIKTDFAGEIKGPWSAIREVTSDGTLFVVTPDQKTVSGTIAVEDRAPAATTAVPANATGAASTTPAASGGTPELIVHTKTEGDVHLPIDKISIIRSPDAQIAYEKSLHPSLTANWKSQTAVGFALARGNSNTTNLNVGFQATRKTLKDQILTKMSAIYATNNEPGGGVTANEILGNARYDRDFYDQTLFGFGSGDFTRDELQGLNLQSIYTGGFGWHAIHSSSTTFDVLSGVNYTRESYSAIAGSATISALQRNLTGITVGEDFKHEFGSITTLTEDFTFYPDLSFPGQYRFAVDAGIETKIKKWLGWEITATDRYVTDPPIAGTRPNDIVVSTNFTATFGH